MRGSFRFAGKGRRRWGRRGPWMVARSGQGWRSVVGGGDERCGCLVCRWLTCQAVFMVALDQPG